VKRFIVEREALLVMEREASAERVTLA